MRGFHSNKLVAGAIVAGLAFAPAVYATAGYFQIGYGAKSVGMAGAGVANPQDTLATAANPAGISFVAPGLDADLRLFSPIRNASLGATRDRSARDLFLIPNVGYTKELNEKLRLGIALYSNGGMNTNYGTNLFAAPFGKLGVDLSQAIFAPTLSYKINDNQSIGISPLIGAQRFSIRGVGAFGRISSDPGSLSNRGADLAAGIGARIGWMGRFTPKLSFGLAYATKIYMSKFSRYSGLFAESGGFDVPANFTAGLALQATPALTFAFDAQRIFYGDVPSIANPGPTATEIGAAFAIPGKTIAAGRKLGAGNGIGFGWKSIWVYKFGARYRVNDRWTVRAGFSHNDSPIPDSEVLMNILAPGTIENHVTLGLSFRPNRQSELTAAYMHAFHHSQRNASTAFLGAPGRWAMHQNALNITYSRNF